MGVFASNGDVNEAESGVAAPSGDAMVSGVPAMVGGSSSSNTTGRILGWPHNVSNRSKITLSI